MRKVLKWFGILLGALVALLLLTLSAVWVLGGRAVYREYEPVAVSALIVPTDSVSLAEGERLAILRGCSGCHASDLGGQLLFEAPFVARLIAPNVTQFVRDHDREDLVRLMRQGVMPNGRGAMAMPSSMFNRLSDDDLGKIIAYIESRPHVERTHSATRVGVLARFMFLRGEFETEATRIDPNVDRAHPDTTALPEFGEYLARTVCTECHGLDLLGDEETPPLVIVSGYSLEEFSHLMRTGEPRLGQELELMADVATYRFVHFTDGEIRALYTFLQDLPAGGI